MSVEQRQNQWTPNVVAGSDLRTYQFRPVRWSNTAVHPATNDATSGPAYVLGNKPNSGQHCAVVLPGAVTQIYVASGGLVVGDWVTVAGSWFTQGSISSTVRIGTVLADVSSGCLGTCLVTL